MFNCLEDDVDAIQADLDLLAAWNEDATEQMKIAIDTDVLQNIYADVSSDNSGTTAGVHSNVIDLGTAAAAETLTKTNVLEYIVRCGIVLDEQNVPQTKRWLLFPPIILGIIKMSDLKNASITGDSESIMRNGRVGTVDRFTLFSTNLLLYVTGDSAYHCLFGHPEGLAFASQMTKMQTIEKPESTFGQLIRGLQVYGYKVNLDKAVGDLYAAYTLPA